MRRRSVAGPLPKLLCVDDDLGARQFYQRILEAHGYRVLLAENGKQALQLLRRHLVGAVVCDYEMPGMSGTELATAIKRRWHRLPVLLLSGHQSVIDDPPASVDAALAKGASLDQVLDLIEKIRSPRRPSVGDLHPLLPLGEALASVAVAAFLLPRILK